MNPALTRARADPDAAEHAAMADPRPRCPRAAVGRAVLALFSQEHGAPALTGVDALIADGPRHARTKIESRYAP